MRYNQIVHDVNRYCKLQPNHYLLPSNLSGLLRWAINLHSNSPSWMNLDNPNHQITKFSAALKFSIIPNLLKFRISRRSWEKCQNNDCQMTRIVDWTIFLHEVEHSVLRTSRETSQVSIRYPRVPFEPKAALKSAQDAKSRKKPVFPKVLGTLGKHSKSIHMRYDIFPEISGLTC